MAGSDQSVNLGGMLTGISNTIGGMSAAGKGYNEAFIQAFKPQIDPSSPESLQAAAEWASNNGRLDEAAGYRKEANAVGAANSKLAQEKSEAEVITKLGEAQQLFNEASLNGNVGGAKQALDKANALLDPSVPMSSSMRMQVQRAVSDMNEQGTQAAEGAAGQRSATAAVQQMFKLEEPEYVDQLPGGQESADLIKDRITQDLLNSSPEVREAYTKQMETYGKMRKAAKLREDEAADAKLNQALQAAWDSKATEADLAEIIAAAGRPSDVGKDWMQLARTRDAKNAATSDSDKVMIVGEGLKLAFKDLDSMPELEGDPALKALHAQYAQLQKLSESGAGVQSQAALAGRMSELHRAALGLASGVREEVRKAERDFDYGRREEARKIATGIPSRQAMSVVIPMVREQTDGWFSKLEITGLLATQLTRDWQLHERGEPTVMFQWGDDGVIEVDSEGTPKVIEGQEERFDSYVNRPREYGGRANTRRDQQLNSRSGTSDIDRTVKQVAEATEGEPVPLPLDIAGHFKEGEWEAMTPAAQREYIAAFNEESKQGR